MAEGFESSYHVPQQSRRDKLRVGGGEEVTVTATVAAAALNLHRQHNHQHQNQQHQGSAGLLPLYDPSSLLPSDLLTCTNQVKEENNPSNLMGLVGGTGISTIPSSSSSSSTSHHHHHRHNHHNHQSPYMDPNTSLPLNPSPIQDTNNSTNTATTTTNTNTSNNPFLYSIHNHHLGDVVVYKPEPLSLTQHHHHHESSSNASGQGLSLSLCSHDNNNLQNNQNILPLELNLQRYGSTGDQQGGYMIPGIFGGGGSTSNDVSRSPVPLGPFTGYASILKGSRFLKPAQILLEELCDVVGRGIYTEKVVPDPGLMDPPLEGLGEGCGVEDGVLCRSEDSEFSRKKSRLISMLNEVCRRYKHYFQQMQAVVTSFEYVAGLGNAAPYANLALKAMSKHFKSLKAAISDQLQFTNKACGQGLGHKKDESSKFNDRINFGQRPQYSSGYLDHQPVWRPQRGLPECAVTVLRAWLFDHFLHPYPTDTDKLMLAKQTGLSRSQVSNWFINARVRLWKPMVEEIHMLETQQAQKGSQRDEHHINRSIDPPPLPNSTATEIASTSTQGINDSPAKRTRNELPIVPVRNEDALHLSYNLSGHPHVNVGGGIGGVSNGVSLTLGLHQNDNRLALSEPFPINAVQRFGLGIEGNNEGYVLGGFETQERHFGRDVFGGQLLHDFVG